MTGTVCLVEGEDVPLEGLELEFAFGESLLHEFCFKGIVLASFVRVVFEDRGGLGGEAGTGAVGCGGGAAFGGVGAGGLFGVLPVGINLSLG